MVVVKTFTGPAPGAEASWTKEWRQADIGAANGHGNARSIAIAQSAISNGGVVNGHQLLSQATIDRIFEVQAEGIDQVLMVPMRSSVSATAWPPSRCRSCPTVGVCVWGGWGGSMVINDLDNRMTITYVMNKMGRAWWATNAVRPW